MLANISTFLQLSLQYCCTVLHLPFTLMYTLTTFHHNYLYQNKYVAHILSMYNVLTQVDTTGDFVHHFFTFCT